MEDSKEYQQALVTLITESENFQMGKVFSSAEEALPHIGELNGIVIVDIKLPGMNGARLVAEISQGNKNVQCIICSMYDDDEFIFSALKNGALGYLLKDSSGDQILAALEGLTKGGSPMSPYIARRVIASFQQRQEKKVTDLLSEREHEVLQQLSQGLIYKEIGEKLFISHETVKQHIKHIYQKLHVQNKVEALNKLRSN
ncbi:MAG TPA: response regulator transcription factor [Chitinophagaceae bacterium]|nr:response regulator transcription factor [Chitinophagaceae bacterium]